MSLAARRRAAVTRSETPRRNPARTTARAPSRRASIHSLDGESASRDLVLVSCEGGEDFFLLAPRHFDEVKRAPKLGRDFIEPRVSYRLITS